MTVIDSHFSNFADGGSLVAGNIVVGLKNGINTKFVYDGGIGTFLPLAGGTMSGAINMDGNLIINSGLPSAPGDLTNKQYVDSVVGNVSPLTTKGDIWVFSNVNTRLAVGTIDGQILQVNSSAGTGLAYSTATYPVSTTLGQLLYSSATNVISGLASNINSVLVTDISGIPSLSSTLPSAVQLNIVALGTQVQALDMGSHLINNVSDPVSAQDAMTLHYAGLTYLALAGGTMAGNINMGGFKATNAADPLNPQDYATKFYVDQNSLTGTSVYAATTGSLGTVTQSGSGVGATLTNAGVQATFALDGVNPPLNSVVLIKDNATGMTAANQGIYTVTDVGSGASNWVLTRSTTYDTPTEINQTGLIIVQNGSTLTGTAWYNATTIVTVDTTSFSYSEFGNIVFPITLAHGGTNANITASAGAIVYSTATEFALSAVGSSGQLFQSAGTSAPGWTTATYPSIATSTGSFIYANGTNFVESTSLWPNTVGANGKFIISNGTSNGYSTSTIPTSAGAVTGKILASDGTNYVLSTATFPVGSATSGKIMQSDGTNWIASSATWPTAATNGKFVIANGTNYLESTSTIPTSAGATAGKALVSDGTNYVLSSFAFPTSVGATGTILRSDGTNWVATTSTYPNTNAINTLLYASSANVMSALATVNSAGLLTNGSGVPGWVAYTGTGAPVLGTSPTITGPLINAVYDQTFNLPVMSFTGAASAVNLIAAVSGATGSPVGFQFSGSDSNVNAAYTTKGTGSHSFYNGLSVSTQPLFVISGAATNTVNYITATGVVTGSNPALTATGTDTNISMNINAKGTGRVAIQGIGTNTAQAAGYVGELLSATNLAASPITFTTGVAKTLQNVTLTPGNWIVWGNIFCSGTTVTSGQVSISTTTNAMADNSLISFGTAAVTAMGMLAPQRPFSVSSNTPVYVVGIFVGTGTLSCSGGIYALRVS